jgi:hypothetical protein
MSDFVEQCGLEWKRLGVSDQLADEMAADLTADLAEARAEGVSAEELLGTSASDPRAFAASWAAERGIIPAPAGRPGARRRPRVLVAFTALAATALIVSAVLLATGQPTVALVTSSATAAHAALPPTAAPVPPGRVTASAATPIEWILLFLAVLALAFAAWLWSNWERSRAPTTAASSSLPGL